jgi:hypothetical protein
MPWRHFLNVTCEYQVGRFIAPAVENAMILTGASIVGLNYFTGVIDEVSVYERALTETKIASHYAAGSGP